MSQQQIELELPENSETDLDENGKTLEVALCATSLRHFSTKYAIIQNQNTGKIEKWQPWDYLLDLIDIIQVYNLVYILKASQLGISWLLAIINDHIANFNETAKCLLLSQGQIEAQDLLSKVNFIHANLPDWLSMPVDKDNRELFALKGTNAQVRALPSTEKAGHGFQGSLITRDELARHEFARENFRAVARSGAPMVELSTANKEDPTNYFQEKTEEYYFHPDTELYTYPSGVELYTNKTKPGTCLVFLSWELRPSREEGMSNEEWWNSRVVSRFTPLEIEEQYPTYITDVFKASITRAFFESQALEDMGYDVMPPIKQDKINTFNHVVRVYKIPDKSRKYLVFTDPSDGVGDPFVTGVMDFVTGEVVCSATGMEQVDRVAEIHDYLTREYGNAKNSYEYTGSVGGSMATCLRNFNTPNQAPRRKMDGKIDEGKKGQWVSGEYRIKRIGELASLGVAKRQIVCHDREFMQQAKMVQREGDKPIMSRKQTFDWVMMMAGLWQLQKYTPRGSCKVVSHIPDSEGWYK